MSVLLRLWFVYPFEIKKILTLRTRRKRGVMSRRRKNRPIQAGIFVLAFLVSATGTASPQSENRIARELCRQNNSKNYRSCRKECETRTDPQYDACATMDFACHRYWLKERSDCWEECVTYRKQGNDSCYRAYPRQDD